MLKLCFVTWNMRFNEKSARRKSWPFALTILSVNEKKQIKVSEHKYLHGNQYLKYASTLYVYKISQLA